MFTQQRETGVFIMVITGPVPALTAMTCVALAAECFQMHILYAMTADTLLGCVLVLLVYMAG